MIWVIRDMESNEYLKVYDPNVHGPGEPYPTGYVEWSPQPEEALTFASKGEAAIFYTQTSTAVPLRPDGQPNRPLTYFTVVIEPLEVVKQ